MFFLKKSIPWYKKKKFIIPLGLFMFLVAVRIAMVPVIHHQLNKFLATFSPSIYFHMADLDLHLIRGAYTFEGLTGRVRTQKENFVNVERVDVSIAWRELFKGRIVTDIDVVGLDFSYTQEILTAMSQAPEKKEEVREKAAKDAKETLFPLKVERVDLRQSALTLDDYPSLEEGKKFQITDIEGRITNLKPEKDFPLSFFNLRATILGNSVVKTAGHLNMMKTPMEWDVDGEMQGFDLTQANIFMRRKLPLTFTKGKLDVYAEAASTDGKVEGYIKPFMKDLDIMQMDEKLKGPKHWLIEAATAMANLFLRTADTHTVATKIPFRMDSKGFQIKTGEALSKAIEHGFQQKLSPGIEDQYGLE